MRLLLFDIDGTLLTCGQQVRPLFGDALEEIFGTRGTVGSFDFAGKTDPQIVLEMMEAEGLPRERVHGEIPRVREAFRRQLTTGLRAEGMRRMPGVWELLGALSQRQDLALGLLTGNWETTGRIKLARLDLDGFFSFGAFGDDSAERRDLVPAALERAAASTGRRFGPRDTVIIGDTRHDVACGHAHGVPTLAVATGGTPAEDLAAAGADWVIENLHQAVEAVPEVFAPAG